jgi:5-methylcytosine-specific restriction enzyme subunit McrC
VVNRALAAGLRFGMGLTDDVSLRGALRGLVALLDESVEAVPLTRALLRQASRETNRLTAAYRPALGLIEVLARSAGIAVDAGQGQLRLPGFLFDMNRFYQALLSRFLSENLEDYTVRDELRLAEMFAYAPGFNPRRRQPPTPRPDFVVLRGSRTVAILDAKYRDLWAEDLPREMLYQLALYSMAEGGRGVATILYPATHSVAQEARIEFRNPLAPGGRCHVVLRPVDTLHLGELVQADWHYHEARARYARWLVFGDERGGE